MNKMQMCRIIYYSLAVLHVSSDIFARNQKHQNCIYSFWYYTRMLLPVGIIGELELAYMYCGDLGDNCLHSVCNTRSCKYRLDALDDERKYRSKHVEQPRNNKLSYTVASFWSFS